MGQFVAPALTEKENAAPTYILYEIALIISSRVEKHRERSGGTVLLALLALLPRRRPAPEDTGRAAARARWVRRFNVASVSSR